MLNKVNQIQSIQNNLFRKYPYIEKDVLICIAKGKYYRDICKYVQSVRAFEKAEEISQFKTYNWFSNWILNEIEISNKTIVLNSFPRRIHVTLTNRCNISCIMCDPPKRIWELPDNTLNELKKFIPYLQNIVWLGGEVFLYPQFKELLQDVSQYSYIKHDICTNALLIDETWIRILDNLNINLTISIDGFTKYTYEKIRKGAKFEDLLHKLEMLSNYTKSKKDDTRGIQIGLQMVLMEDNYHEVDLSLDFLIRYGFNNISLVPLFDSMRSNNSLYNNETKMAKVRDSINSIKKRISNSNITINDEIPIYLPDNKIYTDVSSKQKKPEKSTAAPFLCLWPWHLLTINLYDVASIHCYCGHVVFGDIRKESLKEIWNSHTIRSFRQNIIENNTHNCCSDACNSRKMPKSSLRFD